MSDQDDNAIPFTYVRSIFWGDTDTAQIVFTGKFLDYMFEAMESWMRAYTGSDWFIQTVDEKRGGPIAHLDLDFHSQVTPRDTLHIKVFLDRIGATSVAFRVEGYANGETHAFTGRCVTVGYDYVSGEKMPISDARRKVMEAYQAACELASCA
jgi:acyl-CoA thioesterase FadM